MSYEKDRKLIQKKYNKEVKPYFKFNYIAEIYSRLVGKEIRPDYFSRIINGITKSENLYEISAVLDFLSGLRKRGKDKAKTK